MKIALLSKNNIKFINEKFMTLEEDDPLDDTWELCNNSVLSCISASLSPDIAQSIIYVNNAVQLWTYLQNGFFKGDHFRIFDLLQQIHFVGQGDKSVTI